MEMDLSAYKETPTIGGQKVLSHSFLLRFFQTDKPSDFTLVAQSYRNDAGGDFYGTYTTGLGTVPMYTDGRNSSKVGVYRTCLEVKCPVTTDLWHIMHLSGDVPRPSDDELYKYVKISVINRNATKQCTLR